MLRMRFATIAVASALWMPQPHHAARTRRRVADDDWATGEFAARCAPMEPSADLSPETVASATLRGLQFVDVPHENAGLERAYNFMTPPCRAAVAQTEDRELERFVARGLLSPSLQPFVGCSRIDFGELTRIEGTATRGAMASVSARVVASPLAATRHPSGIPKRDAALPEHAFVVRLQQDRRTATWRVTALIDAVGGQGHQRLY